MKKFKELKLMVEEKKDKYDEGEYDQEGDMAKSDLRSIMANAKELHDMIDDADNLPEWCQNKITLAEDYISTVANYLTAEMNEGAIPAKEKTVTVKHKTSGKELVVTAQKAKELKQHDYHPVKEEVSKADVPAYLRKQKGEKPLTMSDVKAPRKDSISAKENLAKARNEEVEQIEELKKSTLGSYVKKASKNLADRSFDHGEDEHRQYGMGDDAERDAEVERNEKKIATRQQGINRAATKLSKEDVEQIEEGIEVKKEYNDKTEAEHGVYHNGKKIGYVVHHKPSGTHTAYHSPQDDDDYGQIDDFRSHHDAVSQIRHSAGVGVHEEVEQIDELSNKTLYSYLRKTGAVRSSTEVHPRNTSNVPHDLQYQAQDSAKSRINARKGHGSVAPKGYAKEEVQMEDAVGLAKPKTGLTAAAKTLAPQTRVAEASKPPFNKPYTTIKGTITDKSGAKHTPMSRARDIARMAMKKQIEKMKQPVKESLDESRRMEIVREAMKVAKKKKETMAADDKYQPDPMLSSQITKT
jgi:hypothetical protein